MFIFLLTSRPRGWPRSWLVGWLVGYSQASMHLVTAAAADSSGVWERVDVAAVEAALLATAEVMDSTAEDCALAATAKMPATRAELKRILAGVCFRGGCII